MDLTSTQERNRVARDADLDPERALEVAREIKDPWCRCQALAHVAHRLTEKERQQAILDESFAAGLETPEINRRVTVSSWPLKVLCKTGQKTRLKQETHRLVNLIDAESSPVRRADALNYICGAVVTGPEPLFREALAALVSACTTPLKNGKQNNKGQSHLTQWAVIAHRIDSTLADELVRHISGPTHLAHVKESLNKFEHLELEQLCTWPNIAVG